MPEHTNELVNQVIVILALGLMLALFAAWGIRMVRNRKAPKKTVQAQVVSKQTQEDFSPYSGTGKRRRYVVAFSVDGRKKSFYVSELSYRSYQPGKCGTLIYQGDRLIDFR